MNLIARLGLTVTFVFCLNVFFAQSFAQIGLTIVSEGEDGGLEVEAAFARFNANPNEAHELAFAPGIQVHLNQQIIYNGQNRLKITGRGAILVDTRPTIQLFSPVFEFAGDASVSIDSLISQCARFNLHYFSTSRSQKTVSIKDSKFDCMGSDPRGTWVLVDNRSPGDLRVVEEKNQFLNSSNSGGIVIMDRDRGSVEFASIKSRYEGNGRGGMHIDENFAGSVEVTIEDSVFVGNGSSFFPGPPNTILPELVDSFGYFIKESGDGDLELNSSLGQNHWHEPLDPVLANETGRGDMVVNIRGGKYQNIFGTQALNFHSVAGNMEISLKEIEVENFQSSFLDIPPSFAIPFGTLGAVHFLAGRDVRANIVVTESAFSDVANSAIVSHGSSPANPMTLILDQVTFDNIQDPDVYVDTDVLRN